MAKAIVKVRDLMTVNVFVLNTTDKISKAWLMMNEYGVRHLPIVNSGQLVGMLSLTDLFRLNSTITNSTKLPDKLSSEIENLDVQTVMTRKVVSVNPEEPVDEVAIHLVENEYHALPVETNGLLVGIITTSDLIKYLTDFFLKTTKESAFNSADWV